MAWDGRHERRRGRRVEVAESFDCRFELRARVRLLDISGSGALLATEAPLPVETAGELKTLLGTGRFSPSIRVRRCTALPRGEGLHLGALFLSMDEESRKSLEAFLRRATE